MKPGYTIRPATRVDANAIGRLAGELAEHLRHLGDPTVFSFDAVACLRDGFVSQPQFQVLLAEQNQEAVGYLLYHFGYDSDRAAPCLHIQDLYVTADARPAGVGRALQAAAAKIGREAGAVAMVWAVLHQNAAALAFYEKLGATKITEVTVMRLPVDAL